MILTLISIQDFFLPQVIQIITCLHSQLGYKSYAIISAYYLRQNLAVSNNKSQQIEALKRQQLPFSGMKCGGIRQWLCFPVSSRTQAPSKLYSSFISRVIHSLMLLDDILHIPAGEKGRKEKRGRVCIRAVSKIFKNCHSTIPLISYWPAFSLSG